MCVFTHTYIYACPYVNTYTYSTTLILLMPKDSEISTKLKFAYPVLIALRALLYVCKTDKKKTQQTKTICC